MYLLKATMGFDCFLNPRLLRHMILVGMLQSCLAKPIAHLDEMTLNRD